jgi:sugar phosphate isomerase/epimerase
MKELEFTKVEVAISDHGPHLKPEQVISDTNAVMHQLRSAGGLAPAAYCAEIATTDPQEYQRQLRGICRLARLTMAPLVTVAAAAVGSGLEGEVQRLAGLVHLAESEGVVLSLATKIGTLTETPDMAVELCQRVPGLGLTLDPSHYIAGPHQGKCYDQVFPYVRHVQLRDTGRAPGHFQVRIGQGEVEYGRIVTQLMRCNYDRVLSVAVHDIADAPYSMEAEVRKLKFLLESLV